MFQSVTTILTEEKISTIEHFLHKFRKALQHRKLHLVHHYVFTIHMEQDLFTIWGFSKIIV